MRSLFRSRLRFSAIVLTLGFSAGCIRQPVLLAVPERASCRRIQSSSLSGVDWIAPADERDRAKLDAWCRSVGPVIGESAVRRAPATHGVARASNVAVVTWNMHGAAGELGALVRAIRDGTLSGQPISDFVLLLQEVMRRGPEIPNIDRTFPLPRAIPSAAHQSIESLARALELNFVYAPSMRNGAELEDRGSAVLSTLPIDEVAVVELPFERQRRVVVVAGIRGEKAGAPTRFRVATMHLDTGVALTRGGPAQARARQARALIAALARVDQPIVIGGDLNSWWGNDEPAVKALRVEFPDSRMPSGRYSTWSGPLGTAGRLDYIFARLDGPPLAVRRVARRFGSDHYPLIAFLE